MKILILIILSTGALAQMRPKSESKAHFRKLIPIRDSLLIKNSAIKKDRRSGYLKQVLRSNRLLKKILEAGSDSIVIWEDKKEILTGKVFRGILLNSIVSTNLSSPVLIKSMEDPFLGAKFSCKGITKYKRVSTYCDKMIWKNKEYDISVQILNPDGTAGLLGTYDDGKDELMVGAVASDFVGGIVASATDMSETNFSKYPKSNLKNHLINGAVRSSSKISEILMDEYKTKEPIVTVNAGKSVLIYFMEAMK